MRALAAPDSITGGCRRARRTGRTNEGKGAKPVDRARFRRLVQRAVRSLPPEVHRYLDNVTIVVQREPSADDLESAGVEDGVDLFGLYVGTPRTERSDYQMTLPDRIVIFQGALERHFGPRDISREVRMTVVHELAHHLGIDDERLEMLGIG